MNVSYFEAYADWEHDKDESKDRSAQDVQQNELERGAAHDGLVLDAHSVTATLAIDHTMILSEPNQPQSLY